MNAVTVAVSSYVHPALLHLENTVSLDLSSTSGSHFSTPSSHRSLSLEARGVIKTSILFRDECSRGSHSMHVVLLWISVLIPIYFKKRLL